MHYDSLRKASTGVQLMELAEVDAKTAGYELQAAKDLRRDANEALRSMQRHELLGELICDAARKLPTFEIRTSGFPAHSEDKALILAIGDPHYGSEMEIKGLHGEVINRYNPEVFRERMSELLRQTADILYKEEIGRVELMICGDTLDGMLRASQLQHLRYGIVESCMEFAEYMATWVAELRTIASSVNVRFVMGNHGEIRPITGKKGDFPDENMEKIIPWWMKERLRDVRDVTIHLPCSKMQLIDVCGQNVLLAHGDEQKNIDEVCKQSMLLYGKPIDLFICGHEHTEKEIPTGYTRSGSTYVLRVPSLCGVSHFAQRHLFGGKAGAVAVVMERGYGRRCQYPINLQINE